MKTYGMMLVIEAILLKAILKVNAKTQIPKHDEIKLTIYRNRNEFMLLSAYKEIKTDVKGGEKK